MTCKWNPYKSKWKAAKELNLDVSIKKEDNVLYLGASSGGTIKHLCGKTKGLIFAVEISCKMAIGLIKLAKKKRNIAPIIEDARNIKSIKKRLYKKEINIFFQDIPSKDQIDILINASKIVNKNCKIFFVLKTQSISTNIPKKTYFETIKKLEKHFEILDSKTLEPFQKKHYFFILKQK